MTNDPTLISIVLPTYNRAHYLPISIDSILAQTYPHWELIIVDDCSDDDTPHIIAEYIKRDSRIRSIRHSENKKLPAALNTGFNVSQGDYLTWTSDDDIFRPHAFETFAHYLDNRPDIDLVYSNFHKIDADGNDLGLVIVAPPEHLLFKSAVSKSFMYRRRVHEALHGYDETLFLVEDYDFWLRAAKQFKLTSITEDVFLYRRHAESLTDRKRPIVLDLRDKIIRKHMGDMAWATRRDFALSYLHLAEVGRELKRPAQVRADWWRAFRYAPHIVLQRELRIGLERLFGRDRMRPLMRQYRRWRHISTNQ